MLEQKNIHNGSRQKLASKVLGSRDKDGLAENLAEVHTTKRVAQNEAADGSTVFSDIGDGPDRKKDDPPIRPDGESLWREDCFALWALELAMRYIDQNVAVASATRLLSEAAEAGYRGPPQ
ncbi:hypothetical protein ACIP39_08000 [Streptomyces tibetensis]|uniref:hypothetical protein n=1 Tax=Streptomyces tibetensis TaxID=2382123 RepID=UPI0038214537